MRPRLLITRPLPDAVLEAARARFEVEVRDTNAPMDEGECAAALAGYDAILPTLGDAFRAGAFALVPKPRARMLANFGAGTNHIDVAAAKAAGVTVTNTPDVVTDATADLALTLILMTARRAGEGERLVRSGAWEGWHPTQMLGTHVTGKVLGVVGMGRIGRAIARRGHYGFGMEVVFVNRSAVAEPGVPARQVGSLTALAGTADFVVVAVPGCVATFHLIGAEVFAAMKPTGIFVNIARGDVVDEAALIAALQEGRIAGAGLDVYEFEPKVPEGLLACERTVLLPHLGTAALEVRVAMGMRAVEDLVGFHEGRGVRDGVAFND